MKKTIKVALIACLILMVCLFALTACNKDEPTDDTPHIHTEVIDSAVAPTCTEKGLTEGKHCSVCNEVLVAQDILKAPHNYIDGYCTVCGVECHYTRSGNYIYFGEYPQTIKDEDVTITSTQDSRGYYLGSDSFYYAKVTANTYEYGTDYTFSTGDTITRGEVYYFKVEPIRWRILSESDGTALILCDSIIANHRFDDDSYNYVESEIRQWLNETFYETAFTDLQQQNIITTLVDNSTNGLPSGSESDTRENTEDKVFLLSYPEVINSEYGFASNSTDDIARRMQPSDYARATGTYMNTYHAAYYGNCYWWLRSIYITEDVRYINIDGIVGLIYNQQLIYDLEVDYDAAGVVPTLRIVL